MEEIDNAESFVKNLDKIELPTQLVAVLADPLLQKFLLLRPDAEGSSRITNWLMACLGDVASGDADSDLLLDMLEVIRDYAIGTKVRQLHQALTLYELTMVVVITTATLDLLWAISEHMGWRRQAGHGPRNIEFCAPDGFQW